MDNQALKWIRVRNLRPTTAGEENLPVMGMLPKLGQIWLPLATEARLRKKKLEKLWVDYALNIKGPVGPEEGREGFMKGSHGKPQGSGHVVTSGRDVGSLRSNFLSMASLKVWPPGVKRKGSGQALVLRCP